MIVSDQCKRISKSSAKFKTKIATISQRVGLFLTFSMSLDFNIECFWYNRSGSNPHVEQDVIALTRVVMFGFFLRLQYNNTKRLQYKVDNSTAVRIRGLILPRYFPFIYLLGGLSLAFGIVDLLLPVSFIPPEVDSIYLSVQFGVFHIFFEGDATIHTTNFQNSHHPYFNALVASFENIK